MQYIKPINVNKYAAAIRSGQIKLQSGQLVYTCDKDPVLSVYVGTSEQLSRFQKILNKRKQSCIQY
jgi:hypothetical protein